eukprot:scpid82621/ scgid3239/ 
MATSLELSRKQLSVLLVGCGGVGKSSFANSLAGNPTLFTVLDTPGSTESDTNQENTFSIQVQDQQFDLTIIEVRNIADSPSQNADLLLEVMDHFPSGLHQVCFVTSGRFDDADIACFHLLTAVLKDEIVSHTCFVRTRTEEVTEKLTEGFREAIGEKLGLQDVNIFFVDNPKLGECTGADTPGASANCPERARFLAHLATQCAETPYSVQNAKEGMTQRVRPYLDDQKFTKRVTNEDLCGKKEQVAKAELKLRSARGQTTSSEDATVTGHTSDEKQFAIQWRQYLGEFDNGQDIQSKAVTKMDKLVKEHIMMAPTERLQGGEALQAPQLQPQVTDPKTQGQDSTHQEQAQSSADSSVSWRERLREFFSLAPRHDVQSPLVTPHGNHPT